MKTILILFVLWNALALSCDRDNDKPKANALVIEFHPEKCGCCWGWDIKTGDDTIRTESIIVGNTVGYEIRNPVHVSIELGNKDERCSSFMPNLDFYDIKRIEKIE